MPNKLSSLIVREVALCHRGMNKHARVALFKAFPYSPDDAVDHVGDVDNAKRREWAQAANSAYQAAVNDGQSEAEAERIAIAAGNRVINKSDPEPDPVAVLAVEAARLAKEHSDAVSFREALRAQIVERMGWQINEALWPAIDAFRESIANAIANIEDDAQRTAQLEANVRGFLDEVENIAGTVTAKTDPNGGIQMTIEELRKKLEATETAASAMRKALEGAGFKLTEGEGGVLKIEQPAEPEFIEIDGERVNKADVPAPILKRIEADRERLERLEKKHEEAELAKEAESLFPNLAGDPVQKGALLKAVNGISDEDTRKAVHETLKAADASAKAAFASVGKTGSDGGEDTAKAKLNKAARDFANEKGVPFETGFAQYVQTPEGRQLRAEAEAEGRGN